MTDRQTASRLARQLYKGQITFKELTDRYPDDEKDNDIFELFDLIEHEPGTTGLFAVSKKTHDKHIEMIYDLIYKLEPVPDSIDSAKIILYTDIDNRHIKTDNTKHIVAGQAITEISGLTICKYDDTDGYYLFYCDENWKVLNDTFHDTLELAKQQAEFEFKNSISTWRYK
jgi:hypothetical protein